MLPVVGIRSLPMHTSRDEMLAAFGPFAVVFQPMGDDQTPYLSLLHLHHERSIEVVRAIRDAVEVPGSASNVLVLLRDVNWRPQLVGAIATYYDRNADAITQLWAAFDAGSWVTPQIAGILAQCDREFADKAISRLNNLCPLSGAPEFSVDSPIERHSAQGPAGSRHRSSKAAASLFALLPSDVAARFGSGDELQALIAADFDGSADLAASWLGRFLELDAQLDR